MSENKLELQIYEQTAGMLSWNFEELNQALDERLSRYTNLTYTDDQIAEAKLDRARLNSLKKAIDHRKIEVKKEFCEPYDKFALQVKELTTKIERASNGIDSQVKAFEQREKEEKRHRIAEYWTMNNGLDVEIDIDEVFDLKWLNKSCKDPEWQRALTEKADQINTDLKTIASFNAEQSDFCLSKYMECLDLGQVLKAWEVKKAADARAAELKTRMEAERAQREEARKVAEQAKQADPEPIAQIPTESTAELVTPYVEPETAAKEKRYHYVIEFFGDYSVMVKLSDAIRQLEPFGLKYQKKIREEI